MLPGGIPMRLRTACSLLALAALPAFAAQAAPSRRAPTATAPALPPLDQRDIPTQLPKTVRPVQYALNIRPDAEKLAFAGTATIDVDVLQEVREITLNAVDMQFGKVTLAPLTGGASRMEASGVHSDDDEQTATIAFSSKIPTGRYRLTIDYRGKIYQQAPAFFALDYDSAAGRKRALFTQFEAPDARRFFPSWDEPRFRTPYTLSVTVPAGGDVLRDIPAGAAPPRAGGGQ